MGRMVAWARKIWEVVAGNVWAPTGVPVKVGGSAVSPKGWQLDAWRLWHKLGEIRFPTEHLARQVGRLKWDVSVDGEELPADEAADLVDAITYPLGAREFSRMMALNLQVGGEGWAIEDKPNEFFIYSVSTSGLDKLVKDTRSAGSLALRLFYPDPVDPSEAESSVQTAIGPGEELVTLEALSRAQSRSRISQSGLLITAKEIEFLGGADPFGADLERHMQAAIKDVNHPSAMVPIHIEVPQDFVGPDKGVRHITFDRPYDEKLDQRVTMAIKRIALALDVPAELLLGTGEANHWTAWLTALETYTSHLEPIATPIGELMAAIGEELLRRVGRNVTLKITPNASELLAKRSTVRDALDAAKIGAVGLAYVRTSIGAREEDKPTEEDLEILRLVPRETGREPLVDEETGEPAPSQESPVAASLAPARNQMVDGAMAIALSTVRSKVGAKVRAAVRNDKALADSIDGRENSDVVATLGADIASAAIDVNAAVLDGLAPFREWWARERPTSTSPNVATALFAIWIADTLDRPDVEVASIPAGLVAEVAAGKPTRGGTNNAA